MEIVKKIFGFIIGLLKKIGALLFFVLQHPIYTLKQILIYGGILAALLIILTEWLKRHGYDTVIDNIFYKLFPFLF